MEGDNGVLGRDEMSSSSVESGMSRRRKQAQGSRSATKRSAVASNPLSARQSYGPLDMAVRYAEACGLAAQGQYHEARRIYAKLDAVLAGAESEARLRALIRSDLDAVAAMTDALRKLWLGGSGSSRSIRIASWHD